MSQTEYLVSVSIPALEGLPDFPGLAELRSGLQFVLVEEGQSWNVGILNDKVAEQWNRRFQLDSGISATDVDIYFKGRAEPVMPSELLSDLLLQTGCGVVQAHVVRRHTSWRDLMRAWPEKIRDFVDEWSRRPLQTSGRCWGDTADFEEAVGLVDKLVLRGRQLNEADRLSAISGLVSRGQEGLLHAALQVMSAGHRVEAVETWASPRAHDLGSAQGVPPREAARVPGRYAEDVVARWRRLVPEQVAEQEDMVGKLVGLVEKLSREPAGERAISWEFEKLARIIDGLLRTGSSRSSVGDDHDDDEGGEIIKELKKFQAEEGATPWSVARMMKVEFCC
ncbi:unnamed protein product [Prorocentrum cordatum]|uniref:Uncharacterized protein n=1 Tax=Prorocentrum cordatum TaxID=2364126 RepID=A0ABN9PEW1_9DINO|nr:unnamed protein product [Polarella glacialis]